MIRDIMIIKERWMLDGDKRCCLTDLDNFDDIFKFVSVNWALAFTEFREKVI